VRHHYRVGELARIINYGQLSNEECVILDDYCDSYGTVLETHDGYYLVIHRGVKIMLHWSKLEPIIFKEDIAPSFDDELFEV
jgi:hypothetical protein